MFQKMIIFWLNNTISYFTITNGKKTVGCKCVFSIKHKTDGSIERYKVRLIAIGYMYPNLWYRFLIADLTRLAFTYVKNAFLH